MNDEQTLRLLGLARRARALELGEEQVGMSCRAARAKLLLAAADAGEHTVRRAQTFCRTGKPLYLTLPFTKEQLGAALGCNSCALCAFTDPAFALRFTQALESCDEAVVQELTRQTERVQKRRAEQKAHRDHVKHGRK